MKRISYARGKGKLRHNNREMISPNVDKARIKDNIELKRQSLADAYEEIFGDAVAEYNAKQRRSDRKISDYFEKMFGVRADTMRADTVIKNDNKQQSFYEYVVGVGTMHDTGYARARSTKQKAHIDRIKAMQEIKDIQEEKRVVLDSVASRMGNKTIELENISKSYGNRKLISDYSYIFLKNDRIGIIGPNGCGKTTLLKIINGIVRPDSGTIEIGQTIRIGYFSQENEYMDASMKVIDYVKEVGEYVTTSDGKITASQMLERFLFDGAMQWSKIEKLSGGEKRRLYLMRVLMSAPNVLILDEPTNDLDIQTLTILEDYLDHFDGIIITVSHDRYFLDRIVNRTFSFEGDGKIRQFEGGYSDYLIRKELEGLDTEMSLKGHAAATEGQSKKGENSSKDTWKQRKSKLKFTYKEQREFETIDDDIAKLEEKLETLDAQIAANATNSVKLRELMDKKEEAGNELDEKMERWVYLNDLNEKIQNADITKE